MPPKGATNKAPKVNTPSYIGDVARIVAEKRDMSVVELLRVTTENGRSLYRIS